MFSGWIGDELKPYAAELLVAHRAKLEAISEAKHSCDEIDAEAIAGGCRHTARAATVRSILVNG